MYGCSHLHSLRNSQLVCGARSAGRCRLGPRSEVQDFRGTGGANKRDRTLETSHISH